MAMRMRLWLAAQLIPKDWRLVRVERENRGMGRYTDYVVDTYDASADPPFSRSPRQ